MLSPHRLREYTLRLLLSRIKVLGSLLQVYGLPILQAIAILVFPGSYSECIFIPGPRLETAESTTLALSIPRIQPHKGIVRSISSAAKDRISGPDVEHANRQGGPVMGPRSRLHLQLGSEGYLSSHGSNFRRNPVFSPSYWQAIRNSINDPVITVFKVAD